MTDIRVRPLWEPEHPYYAQEGNFFNNDCHASYSSWAEFLENDGSEDLDYNLVYRWDWQVPEPGEGPALPPGVERLLLFFIGQRKALARSVEVLVLREQEPAIRAWLEPRWHKLLDIWAPLSARGDDND